MGVQWGLTMMCFEVIKSPVEEDSEQTSAHHTEQLHLVVKNLDIHSEQPDSEETNSDVPSEQLHSEEKNSEGHLEQLHSEEMNSEVHLEESLRNNMFWKNNRNKVCPK